MKVIQEQLTNVEFDHRLWLNEIGFYFKEMSIYEDRILGLLEVHRDEATESALGEILLRFAEQKNIAEQIKEQIREHLIHINEKIHSNGELKAIVDTVHHKTKENIEVLRKDYGQLKEKIHRFPAFRN